MVVASRTDSSLATGFTQSSLGDALKQAFINAGFPSAIDDFTSGTDRNIVFSHVADSSKAYGTNFLKVRINSSLTIFQQLFTSWNTSTKSGSNGSSEYSYSSSVLSASSSLSMTSLNGGSEYRFVCLSQSSNFWLLGTLIPANRPAWWDLNSFSYGFFCTSVSSLKTWRSSNVNPYSNTDFNLNLGFNEMAIANPVTNKRDMIIGLLLLSQSTAGVAGKTSDDLAHCCASGVARYESIQASGNQYLIISPGVGALGVRIV